MRFDVNIDSYPTRDEALQHFIFREHLANVLPDDARDLEVGQSTDSGNASCRFRFSSTAWLAQLRQSATPVSPFSMLWSSRWPGEPDPNAPAPGVKRLCANGLHLAVNADSGIAACWFVVREPCAAQSD